eukprot:CAMPEP_0119117356 /NCGR_PEP_ID=MMETSP1180-20130426/52794_1 /TAXON_ID=3052 ORGANISM="Chlamydomonas cf sp, Strain CCMP681" /NCGR_SAMPLE_ID=MMETSP1180 /ASSEMBLY_ACC=CAM_ASM_000741 /LENGTH=75 /DNA_ID=CAMNT_0007106603 /DNA_START=1973 /DNA_END=2200 /DNA_ORIENTATION=-
MVHAAAWPPAVQKGDALSPGEDDRGKRKFCMPLLGLSAASGSTRGEESIGSWKASIRYSGAGPRFCALSEMECMF